MATKRPKSETETSNNLFKANDRTEKPIESKPALRVLGSLSGTRVMSVQEDEKFKLITYKYNFSVDSENGYIRVTVDSPGYAQEAYSHFGKTVPHISFSDDKSFEGKWLLEKSGNSLLLLDADDSPLSAHDLPLDKAMSVDMFDDEGIWSSKIILGNKNKAESLETFGKKVNIFGKVDEGPSVEEPESGAGPDSDREKRRNEIKERIRKKREAMQNSRDMKKQAREKRKRGIKELDETNLSRELTFEQKISYYKLDFMTADLKKIDDIEKLIDGPFGRMVLSQLGISKVMQAEDIARSSKLGYPSDMRNEADMRRGGVKTFETMSGLWKHFSEEFDEMIKDGAPKTDMLEMTSAQTASILSFEHAVRSAGLEYKKGQKSGFSYVDPLSVEPFSIDCDVISQLFVQFCRLKGLEAMSVKCGGGKHVVAALLDDSKKPAVYLDATGFLISPDGRKGDEEHMRHLAIMGPDTFSKRHPGSQANDLFDTAGIFDSYEMLTFQENNWTQATKSGVDDYLKKLEYEYVQVWRGDKSRLGLFTAVPICLGVLIRTLDKIIARAKTKELQFELEEARSSAIKAARAFYLEGRESMPTIIIEGIYTQNGRACKGHYAEICQGAAVEEEENKK